MIKEFERYHGVVLSRLVHNVANIKIETYPTKHNASYILNGNIGLYLKYSKKRVSPWRFSFLKEHQNEIAEMKQKLNNIFIIFVCHDDGLVLLSHKEFKQILDEEHEDIEWIAIRRRRNQQYSVSGSDGKLKFKISESEFPKKMFI